MKRELLITRQVEFASAHRLYRDELTEAKNYELFGKCANPYGHGHNYFLEVTLKGEQDPETQMVVHFAQLKRILDELIVVPMDHRHLNYDVDFLKGLLPTSENLVVVLWDRLVPAFTAANFHLNRLRLSSSARNWVEYFGPTQVGES